MVLTAWLRSAVKAVTAAASVVVAAGLGTLFFGPADMIGTLLLALAVVAFAGLVFLQATAGKAPPDTRHKGPIATVMFAALVVLALILLAFVGAYELR